MSAIGKVNARLIHDYVAYGIETTVRCIAEVKAKYQDATRAAYLALFGTAAPETIEE